MKKYITYLVESILGLGIVIFIYCNFDLYEKSKLSDRPFDPNVWGTFSDWCLVIVTTLTAIYLIKTFSAQQKIRKTELTPFFELYLKDDKYWIILKNGTAFNITSISETNQTPIKAIPIWHTYYHPVYVHMPPTTNIGDKLEKKTIINFEDVTKNKYQQIIYQTEDILVIYPPKEM